MRGTLEYSVVSFCPDLTDPNAIAIPVAIVGLLRGRDGREGPSAMFVAARTDLAEEDHIVRDPLTRQILADLPTFLFDQSAKGLEQVSEERLMSWIHDNLRNSLHVSEIAEDDEEIEVRNPTDLVDIIIRLLGEQLTGSFEGQRSEANAFEIPNFHLWPLSSLERRGWGSGEGTGAPVPA